MAMSHVLEQPRHGDGELVGDGKERLERNALDDGGVVRLDLADKAHALPDRLGKLLLRHTAELPIIGDLQSKHAKAFAVSFLHSHSNPVENGIILIPE